MSCEKCEQGKVVVKSKIITQVFGFQIWFLQISNFLQKLLS